MELELEVQRLLRSGRPPEAVAERYKLKLSRPEGSLVGFKYTSSSPMHKRIPQECRGLVLDAAADWAVVALPFLKFFNLGERGAAALDWASARAYEKLDGTLMIMYHHGDRWHAGTTGSVNAGGTMGSSSAPTFGEAFFALLERRWGLPLDSADAQRHTYLWEFVGPQNRILVQYDEPNAVLLGARCRRSGAELLPREAAALAGREYPTAALHDALGSLEDIRASFADVSPLEREGYVVVDAAFNRVKIKHPAYVALHHTGAHQGELTTRKALDVVRAGEASELLAYFPEHAPVVEPLQRAFEALRDELEDAWERAEGLARRRFELAACQTRLPEALEAVRHGEAPSVAAYLRRQPPTTQLLKLLEVRQERVGGAKARRKARRRAAAADHDPPPEEPPSLEAATSSTDGRGKKGKKGNKKKKRNKAVRPKPPPPPPTPPPEWTRVVHGSADSLDLDVVYLLRGAALPPLQECHSFCNADPRENRNLALVANGVVVEAFKGSPDEVNNALRRTWALHGEQNAGVELPLERDVPRDAAAKRTRAVVAVLGLCIHGLGTHEQPLRPNVKSALRAGTPAARARVAAQLDFARFGPHLSASALKSIAFQLGQALALPEQELYTKAEVAERWPALGPALRREPLGAGSWEAMGGMLSSLAAAGTVGGASGVGRGAVGGGEAAGGAEAAGAAAEQ